MVKIMDVAELTQCSPFIMLCLGSIEMDFVTSELCYA